MQVIKTLFSVFMHETRVDTFTLIAKPVITETLMLIKKDEEDYTVPAKRMVVNLIAGVSPVSGSFSLSTTTRDYAIVSHG